MLGDVWVQLPPAVQRFHDSDATRLWSGTARVERGDGWLARVVGAVFRFPDAGDNVDVQVRVETSASGEIWTRTFNGRSFSSALTASETGRGRRLKERFGPFIFEIALTPEDDQLRLAIQRWQFLGISLPAMLAPGGDTHEADSNGQFCFHIEIRHPFTGLIVAYTGTLQPAVETFGRT